MKYNKRIESSWNDKGVAAATDGTCSLAPMSFEGSYVNYLGTKTPKDTRKILCIGNSFSFYSAPSWMLTEIAFGEGHKIDMFGHFKGSQTLGQHCELSHTADCGLNPTYTAKLRAVAEETVLGNESKYYITR